MRIERFEAADLSQAMELARNALGDDALILEARQVRRLWLPSKTWEVVAASEDISDRWAGVITPDALVHTLLEHAAVGADVAAASSWHPTLKMLYGRLLSAGLARQLAVQCVSSAAAELNDEQMADLERTRAVVARHLAPAIPCLRLDDLDLRQHAFVLVGAPGVGKTTAAAKMAKFYADQGKKVHLLSTEEALKASRRWAEQLARFDGVAVEIVSDLTEFASACRWAVDADILIADCPPLSRQDRKNMRLLRDLLLHLDRATALVCVSATMSYHAMLSSVQGYLSLAPGALVVTKLDVATQWATAISVADDVKLPLAWLASDPELRHGIQPASADYLAHHLVFSACTA
ncbi:MAG: hypothetical protein Kow0047_03830 [Anaerolineae bacterium]